MKKGLKYLYALLQFNVIFSIVPREQQQQQKKNPLNTSRIFPRVNHFVNAQWSLRMYSL